MFTRARVERRSKVHSVGWTVDIKIVTEIENWIFLRATCNLST